MHIYNSKRRREAGGQRERISHDWKMVGSSCFVVGREGFASLILFFYWLSGNVKCARDDRHFSHHPPRFFPNLLFYHRLSFLLDVFKIALFGFYIRECFHSTLMRVFLKPLPAWFQCCRAETCILSKSSAWSLCANPGDTNLSCAIGRGDSTVLHPHLLNSSLSPVPRSLARSHSHSPSSCSLLCSHCVECSDTRACTFRCLAGERTWKLCSYLRPKSS